jgi:hypothetical protein
MGTKVFTRNGEVVGVVFEASAEDAKAISESQDAGIVPVQPVKVEAGPELDRAVAVAIGLKSVVLHKGCAYITPRDFDAMRGIEHPTCEGDVACISFQPSADLNAAFAAAEKVGVFNEWSLSRNCDGWTFVDCNDCCNRWIGFHSATPALAICAAILYLMENR